jgi:hypothetical protein
MAAQIFVAETPHVAVADPDGSFIFEGIEPGTYTLSIYAGGNRHDRTIQVTSGRKRGAKLAEAHHPTGPARNQTGPRPASSVTDAEVRFARRHA